MCMQWADFHACILILLQFYKAFGHYANKPRVAASDAASNIHFFALEIYWRFCCYCGAIFWAALAMVAQTK